MILDVSHTNPTSPSPAHARGTRTPRDLAGGVQCNGHGIRCARKIDDGEVPGAAKQEALVGSWSRERIVEAHRLSGIVDTPNKRADVRPRCCIRSIHRRIVSDESRIKP